MPEVAGSQRAHSSPSVVRRLDGLLTPQRLAVYPILLGVGFLVALTVSWVSEFGPSPLPDFLARWTAGRMLIAGHMGELYDVTAQSAVQEATGATSLSWFVSPPFVAALFAPLGALPYPAACLLWLCVSTMLLAFSIRLAKGLWRIPSRHQWRTWLPIISSYPILELIGGGQDTALVLVILLLALTLAENGRGLEAGLLLSLALIKPQLIFMVPLIWLVKRRWAALAGFTFGASVLAAISIALVGINGCIQWLQLPGSTLYTSAVQRDQSWKMVSVPGLLLSWIPPALSSQLLIYAAGAILALLALRWIIRARREHDLMVSLALVTTVLASPHAMVYDLVIILPALTYLVDRSVWLPGTRVLLGVISVGLFFVPLLHGWAEHLPWPLPMIGAPWSAILLGVLWFRIGRMSETSIPKTLNPDPNPARLNL